MSDVTSVALLTSCIALYGIDVQKGWWGGGLFPDFPDLGSLYSAPGSRPATQLMVVTIIRRGHRFKISRTTLNRISEEFSEGI